MKKINKLFIMTFFLLSLMIVASCRANIYTINFELNGGTPAIEAVEVKVGEKVTKPENPTKEGYSFGGWFIDATFVQGYDFETKVNNDYTLYAKWNVNKYTINFDTQGGTSVSSISFDFGSKLKAPEAPTRTGHEFAGWYVDQEFKTKFDWESTMPAKNLTLYAKWEANKYKVIYTSLGIELPELEQLVSYNTMTTEPTAPTREGYTFKGWLLNGEAFDFKTIITKSLTLAALWDINEYTLSFNTNGGSEIENKTYEFNESIVKPANPTKEGYSFAGWKLEDKVYEFTNAKMPAKNIELEAVWTANDYVISYNKNNTSAKGTMANTDAKYAEDVTISANAYTLVGYSFAGWNTKADGTGTTYQANAEVKNLASSGICELFAIWTPNKYNVTFNANGGNGQMAAQSVTFGTVATLNANTFTKEGYSFAGWATEQNGMKVYNDKAEYNTSTENVTLYAVWKANSYTIKFNANSGTGEMEDLAATYDLSINLTKNSFEKIGYKFVGWALSSDGDVKYLDVATIKNLTTAGEVTLYAKWEQVEYTLTINIQNKLTEIKLHYGDAIPAQADPVVEGYEFDGWFAFINEKWTAFSFENAKMPNNDLTVAAKFLGEVTITFISNGSVYTTLKGFEGEAVTGTVANPTKEGYTFAGWYTDQTFENVYTLPTVYPNESYNVYAKWNINKYTITYNTNGGNTIEAEELDYNSTISVAPTKEGYTFAGWFVDEELSEQITKVPASSTTIYAKWNINTYSVSYNANGGTGETVKQDVDYDDIFKLQNNNFTKEGYNFDSWNTKADGSGNKYLALAEVSKLTKENNGEIILYAIWTPISYTVIFKNNGGTGKMADLELTYTQNVKLTKNIFTKEGHTFKGWSTKSAATTPDFTDEDYVMNLTNVDNSEITFYAIWEINEYSVKFISEGKTVSTITVEYGTTFGVLDEPTVTKVGHSYTWKINDAAVSNDYQIKSDVEIIAAFVKNTYTVSFVVDNKPVYTVTREYGAELDFSEYIDELEANIELLAKLETLAGNFMNAYMNGQDYNSIEGQISDYYQKNMSQLKKCAPNSCKTIKNRDFGNLYSIVNSEKTVFQTLLNAYLSNNGNPSKDGYVFKGWVLGESTKYETAKTGDAYEGYVPASDVLSETAYIIASFAGIDPIIIAKDVADGTKIIWDQIDINKLGYNTELFTIDVKYEILNKINANEYSRIDVVNNQGFYQFLTKDTYSIPGELNLFIIATVTITEKATNQIKVILSSNYADEAFYYLLSMKENNLDVDQSGDFYYRGTDPDSESTTFYFFTNMTYDFNTTNFVLTDEKGNLATYADIEIQKGAQGNNSVIKTNDRTTAFYFKTSAESKVFYAKVHELITSFSLGKELTQFNSIKAGNSLFKNAQNAVYQIGAKNIMFSKDNGTADYDNNGFEFKLTVKTSGGKTVDFKNQPDFLVYEFYQYNKTNGKYDIEVENKNMGSYNAATNAWEFTPTSGKYQVKISIKETYVAQKYLTDNVITPLTFEFELNDRANVFSHETLKEVYANTSDGFKNGINIHSNITPIITELQKYTEEAVKAGNPLIIDHNAGLRDGSTVNVAVDKLANYSTEVIKKYSGNAYVRVSTTDLSENYIISGNLFNINGQKLPYSSTESRGNLSPVSGYKIANQQNAIFLYMVTNFAPEVGSTSTSTLHLNDLNITANTTVPSLNSSSDTELESSIDVMNRNSGGYLGVYIYAGSHLTCNNTIINNSTIAIKAIKDDSNINLNYFYSKSNWQNAIFTQIKNGNINICNSELRDSGGAAIHAEDHFSLAGNPINSTVYIDQNTIIENYVSGEEGYFKAYSLEFAVMGMKSSMNSGVENGTSGQYTMLKEIKDEATGLLTTKVNFILLSIPGKSSVNNEAGGTQTGNVKFNIFNVSAGNSETYDFTGVSSANPENKSQLIFNKLDINYIPTEGVLMSCNNIPGMGNAFIVAGVYKA